MEIMKKIYIYINKEVIKKLDSLQIILKHLKDYSTISIIKIFQSLKYYTIKKYLQIS